MAGNFIDQLRNKALDDPYIVEAEASRLAAEHFPDSPLSPDARQAAYRIEQLLSNYVIGGHELPQDVDPDLLQGWISTRGVELALGDRSPRPAVDTDSLSYGRLIEL